MIQLQRTIQVRTFDSEATVAVGRDRPEFLAVARLAADLGHSVGGRDISRELLGGLPEHVGWRVLERALAMGLLEREGDRGPARLSESGQLMLDQGAVLVPEEGVWRFHIADDPLVPDALAHAQRLDADHAKAERDRLYQRERGERPDRGRRPPQLLERASGQVLVSLVDSAAFQVRDLGERGEEGPKGQLTLSLRWARDERPSVRVAGRLPASEEEHAPSIDQGLPIAPALAVLQYDELWVTLVSRATNLDGDELFAWMDRAGVPVLPTTMDRWPEPVRRSLQADLDVPSVQLDDLGPFDATRLTQVPLVAGSPTAAQQWAEWLQWDGIDRYMAPRDVDALAEQVARRFPLHPLQLPRAQTLLSRARANPRDRAARFLLTPSDLGLWS